MGFRLLYTVLFSALLVGQASGQSGKIAGTVVDAATGETLPGVNVLIEGTTQGTATNLDGQFVIIGVRPGSYTVLASFIGYSTQRREGVRVSTDLTTTIDFSLAEEVFEGEEIVVTAEAEKVQKDLTSSEARVSAETIDKLPVTELSQVLDVQAGITTRDGGVHIRGGRSSEVLIMVDGVPVTDTYDGSASIELENAGIEELQVISGTFNAEYGNAMSGVINVVSKEGRGDKIAGTFKAYTGSYLVFGDGGEDYLRGENVEALSSSGIEYRDVDVYSYLPLDPSHFYNLNATLEGPLLSNKLTFFGLGRYFRNTGWQYGARLRNPDGSIGDGEIVSMSEFEKFSWQGNLKYQLSGKVFINLIGLGSSEISDDLGGGRLTPFRWNPEGIPTFRDRGYDTKIKLTHLLSNSTFYTLNIASFYREASSYLYDDAFDSRYNDILINPPDSIEVSPGVFEQFPTGGARFRRGGTDLNRFNRNTRSYLAKGDISSQIGLHHLVKGGVQVRIDNLDFEAFNLIPKTGESGEIIEPFEPTLPLESTSAFNSFTDASPFTVSTYLQDKMEYDNFIVNAGLRLDYFDSRATIPADSEDPNIFNPLKKINRFRDSNGDGVITADEETDDNMLTIQDREAYWYKDAKPKVQLSPRLGVAYPITEQGVVHFSFGLFFQIPTLNNLFDNFGYKIPNLSGTYGPFGNPDLSAQRTTMYEIGFKQGIGDLVFDVTGYYRDVRDWISTSTTIPSAQPGINYVIYANRDYANTRGLTLSLSRPFSGMYGFDANYTFQVVEGSNSNPADEFFASQNNSQPTIALLPLNWDQRHKLAGAFYVGGNQWGASTRFRFESGFPYTPSFTSASVVGNDVRPEFPSNSRRMPATTEIDLSVYKEFAFGGVTPRIFLDVFNVMDRRNVRNVFGDTGRADVTLFEIGDRDPGILVQPDNYREPRRVQLGIEFKF